MTLHFPQDTKDGIERYWAPTVLLAFPRYATFWQKFVGVRVSRSLLRPYAMKFSSQFTSEQRKEFRENHDEICMAHYSLFCHLAGAHYQLQELRRLLPFDGSDQKLFGHWEAFDALYLHLGGAVAQVNHLWGILFLVEGNLNRDPDDRIKGIRKMMKRVLTSRTEISKLVQLEKVEMQVIWIRNSIAHYARIGSIPADGLFFIPQNVGRNLIWRRQLRARKYVSTLIRAEEDLRRTETVINRLEGLLISRLQNLLKTKDAKMIRQ